MISPSQLHVASGLLVKLHGENAAAEPLKEPKTLELFGDLVARLERIVLGATPDEIRSSDERAVVATPQIASVQVEDADADLRT